MTVVDDGTLPDRRGSLTVDDEGTPTSRTVLIEDGILVGYLQDRLNARLMGMRPTGNGRRQSYAHAPMPRMTNTLMLAGAACARGDDPLGQARPVCGEFRRRPGGHHLGQVRVLGQRGLPDRGRQGHRAGEGRDADRQRAGRADQGRRWSATTWRWIPGIGTCGKNGQGVPVGVGQPTLKIAGLTVGGTAA